MTVAAVARGVTHRWPDGGVAVRDVDLELQRGAVTALVGANGAGKTTLLRVMAGILAPSEGEVTLLGVPAPARARGGTRSGLRRRVAYLAQAPALDPEAAVGETLDLLAALHAVPRRSRRGRVLEVAEAFGIAGLLARRVGALSGGQKRRLHLAAGLLHRPEALFLDEPFAGLDADGRKRLWRSLAARARDDGAAVAVISHDLGAVARHADAVAVLEGGTLVERGAPAALVEVMRSAIVKAGEG